MRRLPFLLSLIAALAGTPLRQAEAAHDLACSLAEFGGGDILEEVDGGVGDDSGATIKQEVSHPSVTLAVADAELPPILTTPPLSGPILRDCSDPTPQLPPDSARRHAVLQCFLF